MNVSVSIEITRVEYGLVSGYKFDEIEWFCDRAWNLSVRMDVSVDMSGFWRCNGCVDYLGVKMGDNAMVDTFIDIRKR